MRYNLDYLSAEEFDTMTEEEFLEYLDRKAEMIRQRNTIIPLSPYHQRLGAMVSRMAAGDDITINPTKRKSYGRRKRNKW